MCFGLILPMRGSGSGSTIRQAKAGVMATLTGRAHAAHECCHYWDDAAPPVWVATGFDLDPLAGAEALVEKKPGLSQPS